jgi:hypothetical protein
MFIFVSPSALLYGRAGLDAGQGAAGGLTSTACSLRDVQRDRDFRYVPIADHLFVPKASVFVPKDQ